MNFAKLVKRVSGNTFTVLSHGANKREHLQKVLQGLLKLMEDVGEYGSYFIRFKSDDPNTICITRERKDLEQVVEALPLSSTCAAVPRNICNSDDIHDIEFVTDEFLWLDKRKNATLYVTRKEFGAFRDSFDAMILDSELCKHLEGQHITTAMSTPKPASFGEEEQEMSFEGYVSRVLDDMHGFSEVVFTTLSQGDNKRKHLRKSVLNLIAEMVRTDEYETYSVSYLEDTNTVNITNVSYSVDQMISMLFDAGVSVPYEKRVWPADNDARLEVIDKFFEVCEYYTGAKLYFTRIEDGEFKNFFRFLILDRKCQDIIARCNNVEVTSTPQPMSFCDDSNTSVAAKVETTAENQQLQQGEVMSLVTFLSFCDLEQNDFGNILLSGIKRLYPQLYPVVKETYKVRVNESDTAAVKYLFQVLQAQSVDCTLAEGIEEDPNRRIVERAVGSITDDEWNAMCVAWNAYTSDPQLYKGSVVPDMVRAWLKDFRK